MKHNKFVSDAIRYCDAYTLDPRFLLIGGPTVGKSHFLRNQNHSSSRLQDTDLVWHDWGFFPNWHDMPHEREIPLAWLIRFMTHGTRTGWVTNLWGKEYLNVLLGSNRKGLIFVYRDDPHLILDIMKSRPGYDKRFTLDKLKGWTDGYAKYAHLVSKHPIILGEGQFLSDVVRYDQKTGFTAILPDLSSTR